MKAILNQKWKWAAAIILLLGATFFLLVYMYFFWTCCPGTPKESCQAKGGYFIEVLEVCRLPTSDTGKACRDSSECEGFCEADLSADEIIKIADKNQLEKAGACGKWKNFFSGCFYIVEDGKVERICAD